MVNQLPRFGIMQGRLLPPRKGVIQSFPWENWRDEFQKANLCGLELIEWIFEAENFENNPLFLDSGLREIEDLSRKTNVSVLSVCADYFMDMPLLRVNESQKKERMLILKRLIERCERVGVRYIEMPFVDASAITTPEEIISVAEIMKEHAPLAQRSNITLCLETSLAPEPFLRLLKLIDHPNVKINYDIGNSASLGYDTREELSVYGSWIATVHIKDRVKGGKTVPLGQGDANFSETFAELLKLKYIGPFIFQTARQGDEVTTIKAYLEYMNKYLSPFQKKNG